MKIPINRIHSQRIYTQCACLLSKIYVKQLEMEVGDCVYIANSHKLNLKIYLREFF